MFLLGAFPHNSQAVLWLWEIKVKGMMEPGWRSSTTPAHCAFGMVCACFASFLASFVLGQELCVLAWGGSSLS